MTPPKLSTGLDKTSVIRSAIIITSLYINKQYIPLANHDNSSLNTIKEHFEEIAKILQSYPACTLTFLEIPVYSIYIPNKYKGHKEPNQFKEQDEQLISQVRALNDYIRKLNIRLQKTSPNFSQDINHKKI